MPRRKQDAPRAYVVAPNRRVALELPTGAMAAPGQTVELAPSPDVDALVDTGALVPIRRRRSAPNSP